MAIDISGQQVICQGTLHGMDVGSGCAQRLHRRDPASQSQDTHVSHQRHVFKTAPCISCTRLLLARFGTTYQFGQLVACKHWALDSWLAMTKFSTPLHNNMRHTWVRRRNFKTRKLAVDLCMAPSATCPGHRRCPVAFPACYFKQPASSVQKLAVFSHLERKRSR